MGTTPYRSALRSWRVWLAIGVLGELAWFALLHPLVPLTLRATLMEALLLLPVVGYWYLLCRAVAYLADRSMTLWTRQVISLLLGLSAVAFAVAALWVTHALLGSELGYKLG